VVFGRVAARSEAFAPTCASGGASVVIGSAAGSSADDVVPRARGELLERVSNILAGRAAESGHGVIATFEELRRAQVKALDPAAWCELAVSMDLRQAPMLWVAGTSLVTAQEMLVPASAAFLHHRPPPGCLAMLQAGSAGIAAHVSCSAAVHHALLEVLERDLVWRSWYRTDGRALTLPRPLVSPMLAQTLDQLQLASTALFLPGPANTVGVVVCLYTGERRQQSFGARCVLAENDASLAQGIEVAVYEALMVRWSMDTPVARRAWQDMQETSPAVPPRNGLEHALSAFHRQDSLGYWLAKAVMGNGWRTPATGEADAPAGWRQLARLVAEHTGEDVIAVDTTTPEICADGITVVRVVAPGAHRLPADERCAALPRQPNSHEPLPHPFG
jgi:ribosomal protein S12 methylthiotransferase accessory factor